VNNLAIKITKAMVASDYGLSAIGTRGVYFDEALQIIQIILSSKETDRTSMILKRLKLLHKHNALTVTNKNIEGGFNNGWQDSKK